MKASTRVSSSAIYGLTRSLSLCAGLCLLLVCLVRFPASAAGSTGGGLTSLSKGDKLYTQFSLFQEKNQHRTTNYRRGVLIPVNTPVTYEKHSWNSITVRLQGGEKLVIKNIKDYSGEDIHGIFNRTFSANMVDLSNFSEAEQKAIAAGQVEKGMTKEAVKIAIGYPPAHKTPSLASTEWRYWESRFNTFIVKFDADKVSEVLE